MLALSDSCRYFLFRTACDMRKGFYTLASIVREQMMGDPLSGDIFIFLSRRRNQVKLLRWEGDGFALYSKRLEQGTFEIPMALEEGSFRICHKELMLILQGISLRQVRYRKRYAKV
ncbi:IS66 family insertion sequence element accessory protein TnpB [Paraflavisolibacter sp. H34]|uniref:IS66 family insertion sequence element accessory protein TnpB n=1 Tax=Huijunlia imazamoxiresistens TaxID=3127457 RepID=UPI003016283D